VLERWTATVVMAVGLTWAPGASAAEPAPAPEKAPAVAPEKAPDVAPAPAPTRAPDGVFVGTFEIEGGVAEVRLVLAAGVLVDGAVKLPKADEPLPLEASGPVDRPTLQIGGKRGLDYVRLSVEFFDVDRGAGTFDGVLARHRVSGAWTVERR